MERALIILSLFLCSISLALAREIQGVVMDTDSIPIEFANVTAFANDSVVGGGITNTSGLFKIKVGSDCNRLRVSFVGYDDVILNSIQKNMGRIVLHKTSTTLQEVVVKAPLIRREADRILTKSAGLKVTFISGQLHRLIDLTSHCLKSYFRTRILGHIFPFGSVT